MELPDLLARLRADERQLQRSVEIAKKCVAWTLANGGPSAGETYFVDALAKDCARLLAERRETADALEECARDARMLVRGHSSDCPYQSNFWHTCGCGLDAVRKRWKT